MLCRVPGQTGYSHTVVVAALCKVAALVVGVGGVGANLAVASVAVLFVGGSHGQQARVGKEVECCVCGVCYVCEGRGLHSC